MKKRSGVILLFVILFATLFLSINVSADVVSVNSGGDINLVIDPSGSVEDFFFGVPVTAEEIGEEVIVGGDTGGGGGGETVEKIEISPLEINIDMAVNTSRREVIKITNNEASAKTLSISQSNLDKMIILGAEEITLAPGETKELEVIFVALNETGIFTGKILIGSKSVLVSLNIKTKILLFDSNIIVLNKDYRIPQGNKLRTNVELIPMGDKDRLDVTLNYSIKDYSGKVYLTHSETVLVEERMNFNRNFETGGLPLGEYVIGLELIYPNGVATSSAHFSVIEREQISLSQILIIAGLALIVIILLLIIILFKKFQSHLAGRERKTKKPEKVKKVYVNSKPEHQRKGFFQKRAIRKARRRRERERRKMLKEILRQKKWAEKRNAVLAVRRRKSHKRSLRLKKKLEKQRNREYRRKVNEEKKRERGAQKVRERLAKKKKREQENDSLRRKKLQKKINKEYERKLRTHYRLEKREKKKPLIHKNKKKMNQIIHAKSEMIKPILNAKTRKRRKMLERKYRKEMLTQIRGMK